MLLDICSFETLALSLTVMPSASSDGQQSHRWWYLDKCKQYARIIYKYSIGFKLLSDTVEDGPHLQFEIKSHRFGIQTSSIIELCDSCQVKKNGLDPLIVKDSMCSIEEDVNSS